MVDVAVTNQKLRDRALRIITDLTDLDQPEAEDLLQRSANKIKLALLMHWTGVDSVAGANLLAKHQGNLRAALQEQ